MRITRVWLVLVLSFLVGGSIQALGADRIKPFILASTSNDGVATVAATTRDQLVDVGYRIIGEYAPYENAQILVVTSADLIAAATQTDLGEFGAVLRVAVTDVDEVTQVSYVNPRYLAHAYRLEGDLGAVADSLSKAIGAEESFGSARGLTAKSLRRYHYMIGMEYFRDTYDLGSFDSQEAAVASVAAALENNDAGLAQVYRLELEEQDAVLFGVSMAPEGDESKYHNDAFQMSVVDFADLRGTAYLPYEVLVKNGEVSALHMRFRMAVHFPDLSMMGKHSFMTLMPSPDAIEAALKTLTQN